MATLQQLQAQFDQAQEREDELAVLVATATNDADEQRYDFLLGSAMEYTAMLKVRLNREKRCALRV